MPGRRVPVLGNRCELCTTSVCKNCYNQRREERNESVVNRMQWTRLVGEKKSRGKQLALAL